MTDHDMDLYAPIADDDNPLACAVPFGRDDEEEDEEDEG